MGLSLAPGMDLLRRWQTAAPTTGSAAERDTGGAVLKGACPERFSAGAHVLRSICCVAGAGRPAAGATSALQNRDTPRMASERLRRRWLTRAVATVALFVLVAVTTLHTAPFRRFVLSKVTTALADQQIRLEVGALVYNLLELSVTLHDTRVTTLHRFDVPVFATAPYMRIDLSLLDLVGGRYVIESAVVDGLRIHYQVDPEGQSNLPVPSPREAAVPNAQEPARDLLAYLVEEARIRGAAVRYEDHTVGVDLILPDLDILIDGQRPTRRHEVEVGTSGGVVKHDGYELPLRGHRRPGQCRVPMRC